MKIKIIDKYIIQELAKVFIISVGALTMVLYLDKFLFIAEMIVNRGVTFLEMCRIMLYISPSFFALTVPMSVLAASVVAFNQFSAHNEWTAMKACHLSFLQTMRPVLIFSMLGADIKSVLILFSTSYILLYYSIYIFFTAINLI